LTTNGYVYIEASAFSAKRLRLAKRPRLPRSVCAVAIQPALGEPSMDLTDDGKRNAFWCYRANVDSHRPVKPGFELFRR
jgi:hypothetical protein